MSNIREPIKKSSIEKKNKIIEKGFELMCEQGYHNVNCVDIAKYAEVSTGIIYQYFKNKHDIFMEGVKRYSEEIMLPITNILGIDNVSENLRQILENIIDNFIKSHKISKKAHEELMSMSHIDQEIAEIFNKNELDMTKRTVELLNGEVNYQGLIGFTMIAKIPIRNKIMIEQDTKTQTEERKEYD